MSFTFTYKSIVLVIIHSRILYATLYLPNDESESLDDTNIKNDDTKLSSNSNFVLLTVYDDKVKKTFFNNRNASDVINRIVNRVVNKNSDLHILQKATSSSETNENESDESILDPLRSYHSLLQHDLDQAEDMSQYVHSLNKWYNSRVKTVTVKEYITVKEDTVTKENVMKEDIVTEGNTVNEENTVTNECEKYKKDTVTEYTVKKENTDNTVDGEDIFTDGISAKKDSTKENHERIRQRKLRNKYNYAKKHGRIKNLLLRNGPTRQVTSPKKMKLHSKARDKKRSFQSREHLKRLERLRIRFGGTPTTNGSQKTTRPVKTTINPPPTKEISYKDRIKERADRKLNEKRKRKVDNIMAFLKDNMMSTMYVYHELKRIEKTHEIRDQIRKMIRVMEQPSYKKQKLAENVLRCYRNSLKKAFIELNMWDGRTNNLVQHIVQDYR